MALKSSIPPKPKTPVGVNYDSHLETKPITGHSSMVKKTPGSTPLQGVSPTETVHPGVVTDGTRVHFLGRRTWNLGNFESVSVEVGIDIPTTKDQVNDAYEYASDWVSKRITEAEAEVKG